MNWSKSSQTYEFSTWEWKFKLNTLPPPKMGQKHPVKYLRHLPVGGTAPMGAACLKRALRSQIKTSGRKIPSIKWLKSSHTQEYYPWGWKYSLSFKWK
ncbi:hypothetical protein NPIL_53581 [Nephila pilipes]|uniref:Uncharacterized protein n=1 Tax=Nephila pilipes TaxID=299642 RepID=A0A8X6PAV7_NEPPI|nr:hypothetical protein NPIL_53581 [Nephila pilipes]